VGGTRVCKNEWEKIREQKFEKALRGVSTVCVSGYLLKKVIEHKVEEEQNTVFIPNGVDTELFKKLARNINTISYSSVDFNTLKA